MPATKILLFSLPVTDQDKALAFYVDLLGFELVRHDPMGPDLSWVQIRLPGTETSITLVTWFETMPAGSTKGIVLETDDLDADLDTFRCRGLSIEGEIQQAPWGRFVTFDDPDGNGIVLQGSSPLPDGP
jgi:catechol 2,3-dioxygenase-like lactoylglutathione lyase family enzyme